MMLISGLLVFVLILNRGLGIPVDNTTTSLPIDYTSYETTQMALELTEKTEISSSRVTHTETFHIPNDVMETAGGWMSEFFEGINEATGKLGENVVVWTQKMKETGEYLNKTSDYIHSIGAILGKLGYSMGGELDNIEGELYTLGLRAGSLEQEIHVHSHVEKNKTVRGMSQGDSELQPDKKEESINEGISDNLRTVKSIVNVLSEKINGLLDDKDMLSSESDVLNSIDKLESTFKDYLQLAKESIHELNKTIHDNVENIQVESTTVFTNEMFVNWKESVEEQLLDYSKKVKQLNDDIEEEIKKIDNLISKDASNSQKDYTKSMTTTHRPEMTTNVLLTTSQPSVTPKKDSDTKQKICDSSNASSGRWNVNEEEGDNLSTSTTSKNPIRLLATKLINTVAKSGNAVVQTGKQAAGKLKDMVDAIGKHLVSTMEWFFG